MDVGSNLQTFPPSGAQGKIGGSGGSRPPRDVDGILFIDFLYNYVVIYYLHWNKSCVIVLFGLYRYIFKTSFWF